MGSKKKLFYGLVGAPNISDITTSFLRIIDESVRQGHEVIVWNCGAATMLTHINLKDQKPLNLVELGTERWRYDYPSTVSVINEMITKSEGRLKWYICRHCMKDRGVKDQSPLVHISEPHKFVEYRKYCDVAMFSGII